ncbi:MAG: TRAP transporter small permease [Paracoccus sp. (in: a-proteobacteria)]|uniref:TRAP transporter small permease n=1 Tax=Paracoccus sp. TaxID=267 RepID=UPI002E8649B6|nr:TRAP transporter small permease [Pseudomonadota bacterium]
MPDTRFTARLRRFDRRLSSLVRAICVGLLAAIVLTISASVFSRFIVFTPLNFADALAKYLMQWMVFLGVGLAIRSGEHVLVDIVALRLTPRSAKALLVLTNLLTSVLLAVIAWYGTLNALSATGSRDPFVFGVPMVIPYASVAVGAAYALVQSNITTWLNLQDPGFSLQTPSTRLSE